MVMRTFMVIGCLRVRRLRETALCITLMTICPLSFADAFHGQVSVGPGWTLPTPPQGDNLSAEIVTLSGDLVQTVTVSLGANGSYSIPILHEIAAGSYRVTLKLSHMITSFFDLYSHINPSTGQLYTLGEAMLELSNYASLTAPIGNVRIVFEDTIRWLLDCPPFYNIRAFTNQTIGNQLTYKHRLSDVKH